MQQKQLENKGLIMLGNGTSSSDGALKYQEKSLKQKATEYFITKECSSLLWMYENHPDSGGCRQHRFGKGKMIGEQLLAALINLGDGSNRMEGCKEMNLIIV